jgi:hypothetical protein
VRDEVRDVAAARAELPHRHRSVLRDLQDRQPAVRGHVLVLFADRLFEDVELDVTRLFRERLQRHVIAAVMVQRIEQADEIAARRSESRARGKIGDRADSRIRISARRARARARDEVH